MKDYLDQTIIHGTLRSQDLIPAFFAVLNDLQPVVHGPVEPEFYAECRKYCEDPEKWLCGLYEIDDASMVEDAILDELFDKLSELAPEGYYFGSIEGDGSDFGFWKDESLTDAE